MMSKKYKGALYIGLDAIHLPNGDLILKGEITDLLSEEAALNGNNFEPVYYEDKPQKVVTSKPKKSKKKGDKK
jgi:hypothetical protein